MAIHFKKILGTVAVAVGLISASAVPASALPTYNNGSFAFAAGTNTTTNVTTTNLFSLSSPFMLTTGVGGDFTGVVIPFVTNLSFPGASLGFLNPSSFNFSDPVIGSFSATSTALLQVVAGVNASATWDVEGSFTLGSAYDNAGAILTANETWSLTQTGGPGNSVSLSGTFNSPARPPQIPEPATLTLLGLGLLAAGAMRKRGKAKA